MSGVLAYRRRRDRSGLFAQSPPFDRYRAARGAVAARSDPAPRVIVRVLGSAAGGGVPQWNCACANCEAARAGRAPRRTQSSLALSADGARWLLLNCSPDIAVQIEAFPALHPPAPRGTPITGMLLTDANIDHIGGLAVLRQRGGNRGFVVRSSATIREIATTQPAFAAFAAFPHRWIDVPLGKPIPSNDDDDFVGNALAVTAI